MVPKEFKTFKEGGTECSYRPIGKAYKLRGFLIQIKIKITNKGLGLLTVIK